MTPTEENGAVWVFDPSTATWTLLSPSDPSKPSPPARSYHSSASNGDDKIYFHAGCPETGRLSDLWSFQPSSRTWLQLADASAPPRGGASIAFHQGLLYRMNGFDGKTEQGGNLDIYDPTSNTWLSRQYSADGMSGPTPRSVSALLPLIVGGKPLLVTLFGERDPSSLGHQGAGKILEDIWAYDIGSATWSEVAAKSVEKWAQVMTMISLTEVTDCLLILSNGQEEKHTIPIPNERQAPACTSESHLGTP